MTDSDALELLDRRVGAAVAALDEAVDRVPVPEPPLAPLAPARRAPRWAAPAGIAAVVVLIAAAVGLTVLTRDDTTTITGRQGVTRLALPDPGARGYELAAAFDGAPSPGRAVTDPLHGVEVAVQGPSRADDPWTAAVVSYTVPADRTTLRGEPVDIGVNDAILLDYSMGGVTVGWPDGEQVRYLRSSDLSPDELVALARTVVAEGAAAGEPLPGHEILFSGAPTDALPMLEVGLANQVGVEGVVYRGDGSARFVVGVAPGDEARWRASHALAESVEEVNVRGHDAVIASYGQLEVHEISWLEDDGTLVRVIPMGIDPVELLDVLQQLEPITDEELAALVREYEGEPIHPGAPGDVLGGLTMTEPGLRVEVSIGADDAGAALLIAEVQGPSSSTGWEVTIPDPPGPHAERWSIDDVDDGELIVAMFPTGDNQTGSVRVGSGDSERPSPTIATAGLRGGTLLVAAVFGPEWAEETVHLYGPDGAVLEVPPVGEG